MATLRQAKTANKQYSARTADQILADAGYDPQGYPIQGQVQRDIGWRPDPGPEPTKHDLAGAGGTPGSPLFEDTWGGRIINEKAEERAAAAGRTVAKSARSGSRAGSGGGGARSPVGAIQTTRTEYEGEAPKYAGPVFDRKEIKAMARKLAGPTIRRARIALQDALSKQYENPMMRGIVLRKALEGYGIAVGEARAKAYQTGAQIYGQEYQAKTAEAMNAYNTAMKNYLASAKRISTTQKIYDSGAMADITGIEAGESLDMRKSTGGGGVHWVPGIGYTMKGYY